MSARIKPNTLDILKDTESNARIVNLVVSEQARTYVAQLEWADMAAGLSLTLALLVGTHIHRLAGVLAASMILATVFLHFIVGPEIMFFARAVGRESDAEVRLAALQGAYYMVLAVKLLIGTGLAIFLLMVKTRLRAAAVDEVKPVDHANHSHVNR